MCTFGVAPDHLGKRQPHDITIEQYSPPQWESFDGRGTPAAQDSTRVNFFSGIPAVASVKGILHLYKYVSSGRFVAVLYSI